MMMMSGEENPVYRSSFQCIHKMWKYEGPGSFYKGAGVNMVRNVGSALVLVLYDKLSNHFQ